MSYVLTPAEVADRLACDEPTVLKLVKDRALKAVPLPGGEFRITPAAFEAFLSGDRPRPSPYLDAQQAADFLGVARQTLYNNRRHIPSLPGFRTLRFDPAVLKDLRGSQQFRTKRLKDQHKKRA